MTVKQEFINDQKKILKEISNQEFLISKIRRYFIQNKIDFEDFNDLKKEYKQMMNFLNERLTLVNESLANCNARKNIKDLKDAENNVFNIIQKSRCSW